MGEIERIHHHRFRNLAGARLDHDDRFLGTNHRQVQAAVLQLADLGVHHEAVFHVSHPHRTHGVEERDGGAVQGGGGPGDAQDVRVVFPVRGQHHGDHLGFAHEPLGKEGTQRPVDHPGGQDLLFGRAPLALEEAAGDLPRGVVVLAIIDGQWEEPLPFLGLLERARRRQDHGVTVPDIGGAVGLLGDLAHFDRQFLPADFGGNTMYHLFLQ